jgi:hypothetical protein
MFVEAELPVGMSFHAAKKALGLAVADGGLVAESRRAVDEGMVFLMPVGPRGSQRPAKDVSVRLLRGRAVGGRYVVPLRWEVTGSAGRLFPALDANLELVAAGELECRLAILASYQPPLGKVGETIDRAGMSVVAAATMSALLREIAAQLEYWARSGTSGLTPQLE